MTKLYILCGIPFSGKTTFARKLVAAKHFTRIDFDDVLFELYGHDITSDKMQQKDWDIVYAEMYKRLRSSLSDGQTVIHDTGNFTKSERDVVRKIAEEMGIEAITILVDVPVEIARQRLVRNRETKERFNIPDDEFESTLKEMERPTQDENHLVFPIDSDFEKWVEGNIDK